tara:strand:+ start:1164 stop:1499 length:336 start_codon:yes stop_codon:yes gene_type:complete
MPYQPRELRFWNMVGLTTAECSVSRCVRQVVSGFRVSITRRVTKEAPTLSFHIGIFSTVGEAEGWRDKFTDWWNENKERFDERTKCAEVVNIFRSEAGLPQRTRGTPVRKT